MPLPAFSPAAAIVAVSVSVKNWLPPLVLVLVARLVAAKETASLLAPIDPLTALRVTSPPVTSVPPSPPSVMAPVRAVSVRAFDPASSSVTAIDPPTIVNGSANVELLTSTAPVPLVASPMVIELKLSVNRPISVSLRLKSPVGPPAPMPIVVVAV